ncbi:MAG: protein-tyrosine phosphatase, partial [Chloroflexi bacterium]|nr:protein-tyrosine phosphatase [Chloroflexota bacterium]
LGMENHLEMDSPEQVAHGTTIPIEGTRFMLVELPFEFFPLYTEETLFRLQIKGLRPIIVHPERNSQIQSNTGILANLVQKGAFSQVTAGSITGGFGRPAQRAARELLRQGLVHIIASDSHSPTGRRVPILSEGVAAAARLVGKEAAQRMVEDIPQAILQDSVPDTQGLSQTVRRRWWPLGR